MIVLPHQRLGRYVDRQQWCLDHGGRSELRIAKHDDSTWPHVEAEFLGSGSMIDFGEDHEASRFLLLNRFFKSRDGFVHGILARLGYQAIIGCMCGTPAYREGKYDAPQVVF